MNELSKVLIIIHAAFGGIALISGPISLISKKGNQLYKKSGFCSLSKKEFYKFKVSFNPKS